MQVIEIIENLPDFKVEDIKDIMYSNNWQDNTISKDIDIYNSFMESSYYALAKVDNKTVGVIKVLSDNSYSTTFLDLLIVHKEYQNQGIGTSLLETFEKNYKKTTKWAIIPNSEDKKVVTFFEKSSYKSSNEHFEPYIKTSIKNKESKCKHVEIIENKPDFNPSDIDDIYISIGISSEEIANKNPQYTFYKKYQELDYYAFAKVDGKTVAELTAITDSSNSTTYLQGISVHKDFQKQGIGQKLLDSFHKKFDNTKIYAINCVTKGDTAKEFLNTQGYSNQKNDYSVCVKWRS